MSMFRLAHKSIDINGLNEQPRITPVPLPCRVLHVTPQIERYRPATDTPKTTM
jgi:hypothetical protein